MHKSANNLVTCGIWTTLVSQYTFLGPGNTILEPESPSKTGHISTFDATSDLKSYETFGLDFNNTDTPTYADTISNCLTDIYHVVKQNTFAADGSAPAACTRNKLFPFQSTYTLPLLPTDPGDLTTSGASGSPSLRTCIDAICAPRTLNPDLPGIGVRLSLNRLDHSAESCYLGFFVLPDPIRHRLHSIGCPVSPRAVDTTCQGPPKHLQQRACRCPG